MKKELVPRHLNVGYLANSTQKIDGLATIHEFARIRSEITGDGSEVQVTWAAEAQERDNAGSSSKLWLRLNVDTVLPMTCQRCLTEMQVPISVDRDFRFVESEDIALAEDDESEEDILVGAEDFDLAGLIEDEVLMEMPIVPKHEVCPVPVVLSVTEEGFDEAGEKPNPFAVLQKLKTNKPI